MTNIDAVGNVQTSGDLEAGVGSGVAGSLELPPGTAPIPSSPTSFSLVAPPNIPVGYSWVMPTAQGQGFLYNDGTGQLSYQTPSGSGGSNPPPSNPGAVVLIQKQILSAPTPNIVFLGIPGTYSDLRVVLLGRGDAASNSTNVTIQFNGDAGPNYNWNWLCQQNLGVESYSGYGQANALVGPFTAANNTPNFAGAVTLELVGYSQTTFYKQGLSRSSQRGYAVSNFVHVGSLDWMNTAAITSISLAPQSGNFVVGTMAILYGIQ